MGGSIIKEDKFKEISHGGIMAIIRCKMCGGDLKVSGDLSTVVCEYCGIEQTVPRADDEKKLLQFERAEKLRRACEFDKAAGIYESIIADFANEAEAYWGLVLCKYGIEYVDDPATGKKVPTCHRSSFDSVMDDSDLEMALENADIDARKVLRAEAKVIEEIRKGIISVSANEAPYDIFICYKETDHRGDRTVDSVIAQDIYDALTDRGYRVFFARISLEDKLGLEYEPYIFAALNSARIMLAVGTDYEYYNAVWVKNEWSRFLKQMATDKEKHLIPCYKGIDAYDMPKEFGRLQAQDMGKIGAMQDLLRGIEKLMPKKGGPAKAEPVAESAPAAGTAPLLKRAFMFLDDGDWKSADEYCEKVLDIDPECGRAYLGKLLAELNLNKEEQLCEQTELFDDRSNYLKAYRFADSALKAALDGYVAAVKQSIEDARLAQERALEEERLARERWKEEQRIAHEKEMEERRKAREKQNEAEYSRKDKKYDEAVALIKKKKYKKALAILESISSHRDASALIADCKKGMKKGRAGVFSIIAAIVVIGIISAYFIYPFIPYSNGYYTTYIETFKVRDFSIPSKDRIIKEDALRGSTSVENVSIHLAISSIGRWSFSSCTNLKSIIIPESVKSVGDLAFHGCESLEYVNISDSVEIIGECAFAGCESLKSIKLPKKLDHVNKGMFEDCRALEEVTLPSGIEVIEESAFSNCSSLKSIDLTGVKTIGRNAFSNCSSLENVVLGSSLYNIEDGAFRGCTSLREIVIRMHVKAIGEDAFDGCTNLEEIKFIGTKAQWENLGVEIPSDVRVICSDGEYMH